MKARPIAVVLYTGILAVLIALPGVAEDRVVAHDNALNYTNGTWSGNEGVGLDEWVFVSQNAAGAFLADGAVNLNGIGTGGKAWGAYANNSNSDDKMAAFRGFGYLGGDTWTNRLEDAKDSVSISFEHEVIIGIFGSCGFTLRHNNETATPDSYNAQARFEFGIFCDGDGMAGATYTIYDGDGGLDTGVARRKSGLDLKFILGTNATYSLNVYDATNSVMITNITGRALSGAGTIDSIALYARNIDGGTGNDVFFNSLQIRHYHRPTLFMLK